MAKPKPFNRLIVSFIGNTDLDYLPPIANECSPILRLLLALGNIEPHVDPGNTRLLLFDDQKTNAKPQQTHARPRKTRAQFTVELQGLLPECGLGSLQVELKPLVLPTGPTDLNALYEGVRGAIPRSGMDCADEVLFNVTSGTSAMQLTLLLISQALPLRQVRIFENSREQGVQEVRLPYVLAARELNKQPAAANPKLEQNARNRLIPGSIVKNAQVAKAYARLYKAAKSTAYPVRVLVMGATGTGKWHACRQFAVWRETEVREWLTPAVKPDDMPEQATLLIRQLDAWSLQALHSLSALTAQRPDLAIVASYRNDVPAACTDQQSVLSEGLRGAIQVELPALSARADEVVELAMALAQQMGIKVGKLKERFAYDWVTDIYPRNLHDLQSFLATADAGSAGLHPDAAVYRQARNLQNARDILAEASKILSAMDFGPERHRLDDVLKVIRATTVRLLREQSLSQERVGLRLGFDQRTVSKIEGEVLDMHLWQTQWIADE